MSIELRNFIEQANPLGDQVQKFSSLKSKLVMQNKYQEYLEELSKYSQYLQEDFKEEKGSLNRESQQQILEIKYLTLVTRLQKELKVLTQGKRQKVRIVDLSENLLPPYIFKNNKDLFTKVFAKVVQLNVGGNKLGDEGFAILCDLLGPENSLQSLDISNNKITVASSDKIITFLKYLLHLNLSGNEISDPFFQQLALYLDQPLESIQELLLNQCGVTNRTVYIFQQCIRKFPSLQKLELFNNEIESQFELDFLQSQLILRRISPLQAQDLPCQSTQELEMVHLDHYFNDPQEISTFDYLVKHTRLLLDERVLTLNLERIKTVLGQERKPVLKFVYLYAQTLNQLGAAKGKEETIKLAPIPQSFEVVQAQLNLIYDFRLLAMQRNICLLDLSWNSFGEVYAHKCIHLLKICSYRLAVLKLDGNFMSFVTLNLLKNQISKLGFKQIRYLSLKNCGLKCDITLKEFEDLKKAAAKAHKHKTGQDKQEGPQKGPDSIIGLLETLSQSLVCLDLSDNPLLTSNLFQILKPQKFSSLRSLYLQGCLQTVDQFKDVKRFIKGCWVVFCALLDPSQIYHKSLLDYFHKNIRNVLSINSQRLKEGFPHLPPYQQLLMKSQGLLSGRLQILKEIKILVNGTAQKLLQGTVGETTVVRAFQVMDVESRALEREVLILKEELPKLLELEEEQSRYLHYHASPSSRFWYFEDVSCLLSDLLEKQNYSDFPGLSEHKLALMLLDFYQDFSSKLIHWSQILVIRTPHSQTASYTLKILPLEHESNLEYWSQSIQQSLDKFQNPDEFDEVLRIKLALERYISDHCSTNTGNLVSLYPYWYYLFSRVAQSETGNRKKLQKHAFYEKQEKYREKFLEGVAKQQGLFRRNNLRLMCAFYTIFSEIYELELPSLDNQRSFDFLEQESAQSQQVESQKITDLKSYFNEIMLSLYNSIYENLKEHQQDQLFSDEDEEESMMQRNYSQKSMNQILKKEIEVQDINEKDQLYKRIVTLIQEF